MVKITIVCKITIKTFREIVISKIYLLNAFKDFLALNQVLTRRLMSSVI